MTTSLSWFSIVRLGLIQTSIGASVVIAASTLNRVMVVEIGLPALVPGLLVTMHYAVQMLRPRWGHGSDGGRRRTPWIIAGMAAMSTGCILAAFATALMMTQPAAGIGLAILAYLLIGMGVGAAGTSLLTLLAEQVEPSRRAPAATIVWTMMIAGFAITGVSAGKALDPFSATRLVEVAGIVSAIAFVVSVIAIAGVEQHGTAIKAGTKSSVPFRVALAEIWSEPHTRRFTMFIFVSMLAYNAQELLLEPFAGAIFGMSPGQSTQLGGLQHAGALVGMIIVAIIGYGSGAAEADVLRKFMIGGCVAAGCAMAGVGIGGIVGPSWPIQPSVFALGVANGAFAIAAIGSMMALARQGHASREGVRMGLWGAAQAIAFALGGLIATMGVDAARAILGSPAQAYAIVFICEAIAFIAAAALAAAISRPAVGPVGDLNMEAR